MTIVNNSSRTQPGFNKEQKLLIEQIRAETQAELEGAPIRALRLSPQTLAFLVRAGFRTIRHILRPKPEQLNGVQYLSGEAKQEIRDRLLWAIHQRKRYFRWRVARALQRQPSSSATETRQPTLAPESAELTSQRTPIGNEPTNYLVADDVYALLFPPQTGEEPYTYIRIEAMALSDPTYNALLRSQITTVGQLASLTFEQLLQIDGISNPSATELEEQLTRYTKSKSERILSEPLLGESSAINSLANTPLGVLDLPQHTSRLLNQTAITTVGQLAALTESQLAKLVSVRHLDNRAIEEIREKLAAYLVLPGRQTEETEYPVTPGQPPESGPEIAALPTDGPEIEAPLPEPPAVLPGILEETSAAPDSDESLEQGAVVTGRDQISPPPVDAYGPDSGQPVTVPLESPVEIRPRRPLHKKQRRHIEIDSGSVGRPGTRLHAWELRLQPKFEEVAWVGQLSLSETEFAELCHAIQTEAQKRPNRVPAAVFMTTLVFAARYAQQNADQFWAPYLQTVWQVKYTQGFMARCRKRFKEVVPYLEQAYKFEFPRQTEGDLVAAVYRHALLPHYVQDDLARWLREQWRAILQLADTPDLLIAELRQDKKLDYLPQRLQKFIRSKETEATAVALISNMAAAISLHVNEGETIENISALLANIPIEQELWREVAQVFADTGQNQPASLRQTKPRLNWVWSLADDEMALRVQNIILPVDGNLEGEPDRLVWLEEADTDPLAAEIEVEVSPWRMHTGERVINDLFLAEPDGPLNGQLLLLTDMDEEAMRLDVPPLPAAEVQFFRLTQQGAYGIPVELAQVRDGVWLVCAAGPLTFVDEDEAEVIPDAIQSVPYPLDQRYQWAAQVALNLPVTVKMENAVLLNLAASSSTTLVGRPSIVGTNPIAGLSRQVQPTFADTQVSLVLAQAGEQILKQASLWLRGQDGWRYQRPLTELLASGIVRRVGADLHIHLHQVIPTPAQPNFYLAELRASLRPLLPAPLQFAVVPGLQVVPPPADQLYTPANPPQLVLWGVDDLAPVRRDGLQVEKLSDGRQQITWHDLRHEPRLTLRFDRLDIPLAWSLPHFMAWIEPKPARPFLTLAELQETVLHATGTKTAVSEFRLFIPGQPSRPFSLRHGRYATTIGQSQLYDMVKLAETQPVEVKVQVGEQTWTLLEVRQRPELTAAHLKYDGREQIVHFYTGLTEVWLGDVRLVVESLTNPFAPQVELGRTSSLQEYHRLPAPTLADDVYLLRLILDGVEIPLAENTVQFTVGSPAKPRVQTGPLVREIRGGQLIPAHQAEDFVLLWAENAEKGNSELSATTLYQLATIPAAALENFDFPHLQKLWPPLEKLKAVQDRLQWVTNHGYLPAWILLDRPIILCTVGRGHQLRVYPLQAACGGREGRGYGHLSVSKGAPKEPALIQWQAVTDTQMQVQVEAGLIPTGAPIDWATIDLFDTYALWYCDRCGRLLGSKSHTVPEELQRQHLHGQPEPILYDITVAESHGGYQLLAELIPERRGSRLIDTYAELGLKVHSAATYLPEPAATSVFPVDDGQRLQLRAILREVMRFGKENTEQPYWASAFRLLDDWRNGCSVSEFGQALFAFSTLLREAAKRPKSFHRMIKEASLSESDVHELLVELNQTKLDYVQWGLTWAELLMVHSSWFSSRTGGGRP
jgi:hypothetical protein